MGLNPNRVVVGMSGGVDSSVTAALLVEQGYEVIGLTITPFKIDDECKVKIKNRSCCDYQSIIDVMDICDELGIKHHFMDLSGIFKEKIVDNFIDEYLNGRTPNPCVNCNPIIKWGMLDKADELGAMYLATGHYAIIKNDKSSDRAIISRGKDNLKDQSYFLWKLSKGQIARTMFPLGSFTKNETRALAERYNLKVSHKADSQEICFVTNNDYTSFLRKSVSDIDEKIGLGDIVYDGVVIGKHRGYPFYTIGQRKGLGISYYKPLYVKNINPESNTVEVAADENLLNYGLVAEDVNLIKYDSLEEDKVFTIKIRYRDIGAPANCKINDEGMLEATFLEPRRAITPGQSVVIYEGDDLVGGGIIKIGY